MKFRLPFGKNVLGPLAVSATVLATEAAIQKKILDSGTTKLIISNEEANDIMRIIKSFEDSGLLITAVTKTTANYLKKKHTHTHKREYLGILLSTLSL